MVCRPLIERSKVDLPEPDGPMRAIISPLATSGSRPEWTGPQRSWKYAHGKNGVSHRSQLIIPFGIRKPLFPAPASFHDTDSGPVQPVRCCRDLKRALDDPASTGARKWGQNLFGGAKSLYCTGSSGPEVLTSAANAGLGLTTNGGYVNCTYHSPWTWSVSGRRNVLSPWCGKTSVAVAARWFERNFRVTSSMR